MKRIPLREAKAHLNKYGKQCKKEQIVVTVNGHPAFQLVPVQADDDFIDKLIEHHPDFQRLLKERLKEPSLSVREALRKL